MSYHKFLIWIDAPITFSIDALTVLMYDMLAITLSAIVMILSAMLMILISHSYG